MYAWVKRQSMEVSCRGITRVVVQCNYDYDADGYDYDDGGGGGYA